MSPDALSSGHTNLQEAAQPPRSQPPRDSSATPRRTGSADGLRSQVKELLGETQEPAISSDARVIAQIDEMLEIYPHDTRHMFWEEIKRIFFAVREIKPEDLEDATMDEFVSVMAQLSKTLYRIEKSGRSVRGRPSP